MLPNLRCRLDAVAAELRSLRPALKGARHRSDTRTREWVLTDDLRHAALIMYVLVGHRPNAAAAYLAAAGRQRKWAPQTAEALNAVVEEAFLKVDVDALAALTDPAEPSDAAAFATAVEYVSQLSTAEWVAEAEANIGRGAAVPTRTCAQDVDRRQRQLLGPAAKPSAWRPPPRGSSISSVHMRALPWPPVCHTRGAHIRARCLEASDAMFGAWWLRPFVVRSYTAASRASMLY